MGYDPDRALLADAGVKVDVLDSGCCGLAGNFGFETGHYDASMVCAERVLPAVRSAAEETLSWRTGSAAAPRASTPARAGSRSTWPNLSTAGLTAAGAAALTAVITAFNKH
jgi:hypothetical protein